MLVYGVGMGVAKFYIFCNKKVLLRERKRHTACRVVTTHSVVLSWLTPPPPLPAGPDPPGWTWPPSQLDLTPPPHWLDLTPPSWTWPPPSWTEDWPPPPRGQTESWMDGQTRVKTLPSRRTTYTGGNKRGTQIWDQFNMRSIATNEIIDWFSFSPLIIFH